MRTIASTARLRACVAVAIFLPGAMACAQDGSWANSARAEAAQKHFDTATRIVEQQLATNPDDLEAGAWHARLLAWQGEWGQAEAEYRRVLAKAPADTDILAGLSDVLLWQDRLNESLAVLDMARAISPTDSAILIRRARLLSLLKRQREARAEYEAVLRLNASHAEARSGLESLAPEHHHELRFGLDTDTFNYTDTATTESVALISQWNSKWTTTFSSTTYQRFGAVAERFTARLTRRVGANWFAIGGGAGHDEAIIPRREFALEYGRGMRIADHGLLRAAEVSFSPQWFWYREATIATLTSAALLYLPHEWTWTLTLVAARSSFLVIGAEWQPAGSTRLSFPIRSDRLRGSLGFAVGAENFATADQVGHFSARTFSGGLKYRVSAAQDIGGYIAYQARSQQRTQSSVGFSYGIHF